MKFKFVSTKQTADVPEGFYYVSQDNYYIANLNQPNPNRPEKHLYSDSATSCIIIIIEGKDKDSNPIVATTHLSREQRFLDFFNLAGQTFYGPASVFAQGANPPFADASIQNTATLLKWVNENNKAHYDNCPPDLMKPNWYINQLTLSLGQGDPLVDDRSCYGIDLETMMVSNQYFALTDQQRDPTGGVQTLFCVFGLKIVPPAVLHQADQDFPKSQVDLLVQKAKENGWENILYMTKDEVLNKYSSTPQYEVPWFFSTLRESALFVKNYKP
jgi:hypothetical protein